MEVIAKFTISGVSLTCFNLNQRVPVYSFTRPEKSSRNYVLPRGVEEAMIVSSIL